MLRLFLAALAGLVLTTGPALAGPQKPLTLQGGQFKQLQAGDTIAVNPATTAGASVNIPHGTAPSSPTNGDIWTTASGVYARVNGATNKLAGTADTNTFIYTLNTATADAATQVFQNSSRTAYSIYSPLIPAGYYFSDVVRVVADLQPGTTVQGQSGVGVYTYNSVAQGTAPNEKNAVGLYAEGVSAVDGAATWGVNTACIDNTSNGLATLTGRKCIGWEADFQVNGASTIQGNAFIIQGDGTPASANGVQISANQTTNARWDYGFIVDDGAVTSSALEIGALSNAGTNIAGSPLNFSYRNSGGSRVQMRQQAVNGALNFTSTDGALPDGIFISAGNANPLIGVTGASANANLNLAAKGTGLVQFSSSLGAIAVSGTIATTQYVKFPSYTVATLPTCNSSLKGAMTAASDLSAVTYNATAAGGGSLSAPVFCNGTNWTVH